jgi:hypothetical protein
MVADARFRMMQPLRATIATATGSNRLGVGIVFALAGRSNAIGHGDNVFTTANDTVSFLSGGSARLLQSGGDAEAAPHHPPAATAHPRQATKNPRETAKQPSPRPKPPRG